MWAEHVTPTSPAQEPILWVYQPGRAWVLSSFQRVGRTSKNLWVQNTSVESQENRLTADNTRSQLGPGSSRPASVLPASSSPICPPHSLLSTSIPVSVCYLSLLISFHLLLPVCLSPSSCLSPASLLCLSCVGISHCLRLLTSLSLHVSLHLCFSLPVCVSVSLSLRIHLSVSLSLHVSAHLSLEVPKARDKIPLVCLQRGPPHGVSGSKGSGQ